MEATSYRRRIIGRVLFAFCLAIFSNGCKEEVKNSDDNSNSGNTQDGSNGVNTNSGGKYYYTGHDGTNDYSLLLPGFRDYTVADSSIAKIAKESVTLSETTIEELLADMKKSNSDFDETAECRFRKMLERDQSAYRITPVKPGTTTLETSRGNRGGRDSWGSADAGISLVVNEYSTNQYDSGKARYTTTASGLLTACVSCHETGEEGAPSHELGNIKELSDSQGLQWVTTGKVNSRVATTAHTWEFNNNEEREGIMPYLRAKAAKDIETFTKLVFEERFQNFEIPSGGFQGPPPGGGDDDCT